jgi:HAMP domain-containing protein
MEIAITLGVTVVLVTAFLSACSWAFNRNIKRRERILNNAQTRR